MITLSIVSHGQASLVASLLEDIARIDTPRITAIIVTHNIPEIGPPWPPSLASRITSIFNAEPRGFGANHNAAFLRCATPYFTVMNPDLRLVADPFENLVALFASDRPKKAGVKGIGIAAPTIVTSDGTPEDSLRSLITPAALLRRRLAPSSRARASIPHWIAGMFLFVSSAAFRSVGGFDERYFMYCEDFDLCARMRLAGWDFEIEEKTTVVHVAQRASHRSRRHLMWHISSLIRMWTSSAFWRYRRLLIAERG
jgi:GT2 family glycosyltransferase